MSRNLVMQSSRWICVLALAGAGIARAEEIAPVQSRTFELSMSGGYGQGVGPVGSGAPKLQDVGHAGGTLAMESGLRLDPRWLVGVYGEFGYFGAGNEAGSDHATTGAAGVQGQFHLAPDRRYDPWVGLGFGWRGYWADRAAGTHTLQGLDLARARLGLDYRISDHLAVGPVVGMTVTYFISESRPGADDYSDVNDRKMNTFMFGGLTGRFDM